MDAYQPCPCGSGKKYKFCCRQQDRVALGASLLSSDGVPARVMEILHRGNELIGELRFDDAEDCFQEALRRAPNLTSIHTNLALLLFHRNDAEQALEHVRYVVQKLEPNNVFALSSIVHYATVLGYEEEAEAAATALKPLRAPDPAAFVKQLEAWARLRWHEAIVSTEPQIRKARGEIACELNYYLGVAKANLGRYKESLPHLRLAKESRQYTSVLERLIAKIESGEHLSEPRASFLYLAPHQWLSVDDTKRMNQGEEPLGPGVAEFLLEMAYAGDESAVNMLGQVEGPRATAVLKKLAGGQEGRYDLRMRALQELSRRGDVLPDEEFRFWDGQNWTRVGLSVMEITEDAIYPIPDEELPNFELAVALGREGRFEEAFEAWGTIAKRMPNHPVPQFNLGVTELFLQQPERARAYFEQALKLAPDYLYPRVGLARLLFEDGDLEGARNELYRAGDPLRSHPDMYRAWLMLAIQIAAASEEQEELARLGELLKTFDSRGD